MRSDYTLYPSAIEKIKKSGIDVRVKKLKESEDGLSYIGGHILEYEIVDFVKHLTEDGFYKNIPQDFKKHYMKTMNGILRNPSSFCWSIQKPSGMVTEPCDLEDLLLFSGDLASMILTPDEIWDYSKFGFTSPSEFVTTVGAFITQQSRGSVSVREGYKWTTKQDESEIITEVTGDMHCDLRIFQTDIAPYLTTDPFGNSIEMRPTIKDDRNAVMPYHSTEAKLLVAVMKYIEQQEIQTEFQKDKAKKLVEWGRSLGQGGGTCTEHFGGFDHDPINFFVTYDLPIPQLNEANETDQPFTFWLPTTSEGSYFTYVAHNGDFVLSYQDKENPVKPINMRFLPEDAEHLVNGLIYQSAEGLGRTSAKQLLDIIEFRFSDVFDERLSFLKKPY
ncbi:hypothetical protein HOC32_04815 [Candidatus Woesearchaeota archaeon]|nr:hypothetical protein [Candidatus Woesearchaeota archaeon]